MANLAVGGGRLVVVVAAIGAAAALHTPLHEVAHCALWWSTGSRAPCHIRLARPGEALDGNPLRQGEAWSEDYVPWPDDETAHRVIGAATVLVAGVLVLGGGLWVGKGFAEGS